MSAVLVKSSKWSIERGTGCQGQCCTALLSLLYLRSSSRQMRVLMVLAWWTGIYTQCNGTHLHRHAECIRRNMRFACFQKTAKFAYFFRSLLRVEERGAEARRSIPSCTERNLSSLLVLSSISSMRAPRLDWVKVYDTLLSSSRNRSLILSSVPRALSLAVSYLNGLATVRSNSADRYYLVRV
jgi:hypothetical protein